MITLANTTKVQGWSKQSIVKDFGRASASTWLEGFASGSDIAKTGGTAVPSTHLVISNSDAIALIGLTEAGNSTALQYLYRTNSNAITFLDRSVRTNSNAKAAWLRTSSNAYAYADRTSSNALAFLTNRATQPQLGNNLDGTDMVIYQPYHHVFHGVGSARGFVRLNAGFTVLPNASVLMDTIETVSGGFDLRETGTLILNNDLYLSGNVTLTSGGNIKGKSSVSGSGNTIFLGGDLTLSSSNVGRVLHITGDWTNSGTSGDTIIDGQGHCLWIGDRAQIFVDTNVTLTLKNMVIHTGPKSINSVPAIQLAAHGSTLALDNVVMDLGGDFNFINGQLFIHDDVLVTGTSSFVYQSPRPSYITSGGVLMFDIGTTFSMAPSTFTTDQSPSMTNNFLVMADQTSMLALNGCTLKTTYTGLRLRTGTVLMDNRVKIDTMAGVDLATTTTTPVSFVGGAMTGHHPTWVVWSPDGRFVAVVNYFGDNTLQVYRFRGTGVPMLLGTVVTGGYPESAAWSSDGRFLAVVNGYDDTLQVYRVTSSGLPASLGTVGTGTWPVSVAWSPDGRFLAVANENDNSLWVYSFTGSGLPVFQGTVNTGSVPFSVIWSPDGRFLAEVNSDDNTLKVYRFKGTGVPVLLGSVATGSSPWHVAWSPDERFLAVVNYFVDTMWVYRFSGTGTPVLLGTVATGVSPYEVSWSPDGRFLAEVNSDDDTLKVFRFTSSGVLTLLGSVATGSGLNSGCWSPDGRFIAVVNYSGETLQIFRANYVSVAESQAMTSGLVFGDSDNGSAFDVNVQVLSRARVEIKGKVLDASA